MVPLRKAALMKRTRGRGLAEFAAGEHVGCRLVADRHVHTEEEMMVFSSAQNGVVHFDPSHILEPPPGTVKVGYYGGTALPDPTTFASHTTTLPNTGHLGASSTTNPFATMNTKLTFGTVSEPVVSGNDAVKAILFEIEGSPDRREAARAWLTRITKEITDLLRGEDE